MRDLLTVRQMDWATVSAFSDVITCKNPVFWQCNLYSCVMAVVQFLVCGQQSAFVNNGSVCGGEIFASCEIVCRLCSYYLFIKGHFFQVQFFYEQISKQHNFSASLFSPSESYRVSPVSFTTMKTTSLSFSVTIKTHWVLIVVVAGPKWGLCHFFGSDRAGSSLPVDVPFIETWGIIWLGVMQTQERRLGQSLNIRTAKLLSSRAKLLISDACV